MESERVRLSVPTSPRPSIKAQGTSSLLDIVRGEINKQGQIAKGEQTNKVEKCDPSLKGIKKLEQKMKDAIREEKYEEAAKIRDEIAALNKSGKEPG